MSTKQSIKWKDQSDGVGYHLYNDLLDNDEGPNPPPVYLRLDGVHLELYTLETGISVTVMIPDHIARELGLLPKELEKS